VLRFEAQAEGLLELEGRRRHAALREAHQEARRNHGAVADERHAAGGNVAAMEVDLAVEVGRHFELTVRRDRGSEPPGKPTILSSWCELERRDQREGISCSLFSPDEDRGGRSRLQGSERCAGSVKFLLSQRA